MPVLIGGGGSTGSTLLRTVLNRHPDIYSGRELNFFNKALVFLNWRKASCRLFSRFTQPLTTDGWVPYPGTRLAHPEYGWQKNEVLQLARASVSVVDFSHAFFTKPLDNAHAHTWVEKTPSNAYCFDFFLKAFPEGQVIHTTRHPLDAVASLVSRGITPIFAAGMWVHNTLAAMSMVRHPSYLAVSYERFVAHPEATTSSILAFMGMDPLNGPKLTTPLQGDTTLTVNGWKHRPDGEISQASVGRYRHLPERLRAEILTALSVFRIKQTLVARQRLPGNNCETACHLLGYEFQPTYDVRFRRKFAGIMLWERVRRTLRRFETGGRKFHFTTEWS